MSENKSKEQSERKEKQQEAPDYESKWKRAVADYRNLEKRFAKEREELIEFSNFLLISKLLPVLDDLEEAAQKGRDEGVAKILKKFRNILKGEGLSEIEVLGKEFDPKVMEGVGREEVSSEGASELSAGEVDAGMRVVEVVCKGYTLNGKLLRPARVRVGSES